MSQKAYAKVETFSGLMRGTHHLTIKELEMRGDTEAVALLQSGHRVTMLIGQSLEERKKEEWENNKRTMCTDALGSYVWGEVYDNSPGADRSQFAKPIGQAKNYFLIRKEVRAFTLPTAQLIAVFARAILAQWQWRMDWVLEHPTDLSPGSRIGAPCTSPNMQTEPIDGYQFCAQLANTSISTTFVEYDEERRVKSARGLNFFNPPDFVELLGAAIGVAPEGAEWEQGWHARPILSEDWQTVIFIELVEQEPEALPANENAGLFEVV